MTEGNNRGLRLRVCTGPDAGLELLVYGPVSRPVAIGRSVDETRDLRCSDTKVSRHHATIESSDKGYSITDHGSTNRTRLNGRLLKPETPERIRNGDELQFGPDTLVKIEFLTLAKPKETANGPPPRYEFGPYGIYEPLCRGNTDRVDVAVDTRNGKHVALKRFAAGRLPRAARKRLLDQADAARQWQHPNIASVLDAGQEGEVVYIASRLVDGLSLEQIQQRLPAGVEPIVALYLIRNTCVGIAYALSTHPDFVHCNLRPSTIMLSYQGEVMLIDFGLSPLTALLEGTARLERKKAIYLAPEHRVQRGTDPRSDVYSLGAILHELLAREPLDPRRAAEIPDVGKIRPEALPELTALVQRTLERNPDLRPANATAMEKQLAAVMQRMSPGYGRPEAIAWMIQSRLGLWR